MWVGRRARLVNRQFRQGAPARASREGIMEQATQPVIPAALSGVHPNRQAEADISSPGGTPWTYATPPPPAQRDACARCGVPAAFGASFCAHCGTPLAAPDQSARAVPYAGGPYAPAPAPMPYVGGYPNTGGYPVGMPAPTWQAPAAGMTIAMPAPTALGNVLVAPYAGFWLRLAAFVLDVFGLVVIYTVVYIIGLIVIGQSNAAPDEAIQTRLQLTRVLLIATPWLYYTVAESSRHQGTFGKRMIGLRVVDEAGRRISFARANGRFWSKQLSALTCGVGYVVCAFTQRKQALHDLMSGCYVVSIRR